MTETKSTTCNNHVLSVIVPVFNMAESLDRCVKSVVGQDYDGLEVVLVDDGSTDGSAALCDKWAECDSRVVVVHKPNGGLSQARNAGLAVAKGELLTFVDADDFVAPHTYANVLADMADDCDIMEFPVLRFYGSKRQSLLTFGGETYTTKADYWLRGQAYAHAYMWNKIFRRRLFDQERFPEGVLFEDVHILPRLLDHCRRVDNTNRGLYYYCDNPHGITATANGAALQSLLNAHLHTGMMTANEEYYLHVLNIQLSTCALTGGKSSMPPMRISGLGRLNMTMRLKALALNTIGLDNLCKLYGTISKTTRHW